MCEAVTSRIPKDWRVAIVIVGATLGSTFTALSWMESKMSRAAAAEANRLVEPVADEFREHMTQVRELRPVMERTVSDLESKLDAMNHKADMLIEDCYRRGGCRR